MRRLKGRTALVTGASGGLGAYIVQALAKQQMNLVLAARSVPELEQSATELRQYGCRVLTVPTDVTDVSALEALVVKAQEAFGGIDVLVNNAGVDLMGAYDGFTIAQIECALQLNLIAPMLLTRLVLPGMLAQRRGHIVNIASAAGKFPMECFDTYCAAKAGLIGFTASLRASFRRTGVSASAICPGMVRGVGMWQRIEDATHVHMPPLLGSTTPRAVARAVVRAIKGDRAEMIVNTIPSRPALALYQLFPTVIGHILPWVGFDVFRRAASAAERQITHSSAPPPHAA